MTILLEVRVFLILDGGLDISVETSRSKVIVYNYSLGIEKNVVSV